MKKATAIILGLISISSLSAQKSNNNQESGFVTCSEFHITKPLRELLANNIVNDDEVYDRERESEDRDANIPQKFKKTVEKDGPAYGNDDATIQNRMGTVLPVRAPLQNWGGQTSGAYPLDPTGAAGKNHFIQMVNATPFKIWSKTGTQLLTGSLGSLWTPATANDGDPIALYDKPADRWFLAQFEVSTRKIFIAISTTPDPTGSWYTYTFTAPSSFPDYLKFSVWQDGYYMTCNQSTQRVYAFERTQMLAGNAASRFVYQTFSPPHTGNSFFVPLAGDTGDGTLAPAGTPCPIFSFSDNGWGGSFSDAVNIYKAAVNWTPATPTMTVTSAGSVASSAFDASYSSAWNDISQPGTTQKLDGIGGAMMFRAQFKVFSTYNAVVLNWAVKISSTQRSIKWCELRQDPTTGTWTMYQQGIYAPDTDTRWMGSIAMNDNGDIALCYMKSNATTIYPGLYYTGRRACDPLGTLPVAETTVFAGTASQVGVNRDGDYSQTWLDPDGKTFWHTGMYMGSGGSQQTRVYSFVLPPCVSNNPPAPDFVSSLSSSCSGQAVSFTDISTNAPTSWAWTFTDGTTTLTDTAQNPTVTFATAGTYSVTLTATNSFGSNTVTVNNYITVNQAPATPNATSNSPLCSGQVINFGTSAVAGATYAWTGPVAYNSALQNPTRPAAPALAGTYSITVTLNGCTSAPGTVTVVVNPNPSTPAVTSNSPVCAGNTLNLNGPTVANATYNWSGPNSFTSSTQNNSIPAATTAMAGTYSLSVTVNGCNSVAGTSTVVIGTTTPPTPTISISGVALISSAAGGYQWYLNGTVITGATSQLYTPTQSGVYTVITTVGGCPSAASAGLNITNAGIAEYSEDNSLEIFPNPSDGMFTVSFHAAAKMTYKLKLYNAIGQLILMNTFEDVIGDFVQPIDISDKGKGVYMFVLTDVKNQTVKKVVVY